MTDIATNPFTVLFVDEEPHMQNALKRSFRHMRTAWDLRFATSPDEAMQALARRPADVLVCAMQFSGRSGLDLLKDVRDHYPRCVRIILSGTVSREVLLRSADIAHQYLTKPFEAEDLEGAIRGAFFVKKLIENSSLQKLISRIGSLPCLPSIYSELTAEMNSEDASVHKIGNLIAKDPALTAKLLKLANSSLFGRPQRIADPVKAAGMLGLDMVRAIVLTASILEDFKDLKSRHFSVEHLWEHAVVTASLCKAITQGQNFDNASPDVAFSAGLLHDIGKLLIAAHLPDSLAAIVQYMDRHQATITTAESHVLGTNHAAIGAYLLGLWGLPAPIVAVVAFHHAPDEQSGDDLLSLAIVHVADAFANSHCFLSTDGEPREFLDRAFLDRAGVTACLEQWRSVCARRLEELR